MITELEGSLFFFSFGKGIGLVPVDREQRRSEEELVFLLRLLAGWVGWMKSCPMWGGVW